MKLDEAKEQFISSWGTLGSSWGVSKTMAQIHALLMISPEPLHAEEIMEALNISRGNTNMNVRALMDWGLVEKIHKLGERKEFFEAEKDLWLIASRIASERRKRELEPILRILNNLEEVNDSKADQKELKQFTGQMKELKQFTGKVDKIFNKLTAANEKWFTSVLMKLFR
ncbi:MAG: transcriptional regulator [Flavobacteriales bacterium]|nr:transcriptional regulator [Flavobacteriales bacterium]